MLIQGRFECLLSLWGVLNIGVMLVIIWRTEIHQHHCIRSNEHARLLRQVEQQQCRRDDVLCSRRRQQQQHSRNRKNPLYNQNYTLHRLHHDLGIPLSTINATLHQHLPPWQHVVDQYGEDIIIDKGYSHVCHHDKNNTRFIVAPTGLFHSGTHLLYELMQRNCPKVRVLFQPPWGKHTPVGATDEHLNANVLPIVLIRHPYDWFERMCVQPYGAELNRTESRCPHLTTTTNKRDDSILAGNSVRIFYNSSFPTTYESLIHMWNRWYRPYYDSFHARIMVRLEDLMFYPDRVIPKLCQCLSGSQETSTQNRPFHAVVDSSKANYEGHGPSEMRIGLIEAFTRYGWKRQYQKWNREDLQAARALLDRDMMEAFGYQHPRTLDSTTGPWI